MTQEEVVQMLKKHKDEQLCFDEVAELMPDLGDFSLRTNLRKLRRRNMVGSKWIGNKYIYWYKE